MKKNLFIILTICLLIVVVVMSFLYFNASRSLKSTKDELMVYKSITSMPFKDNKITILGEDILVNANQKYYYLTGDCSKLNSESDDIVSVKGVISYNVLDNFSGNIGTYLRGFDNDLKVVEDPTKAVYFDIVIYSKKNNTGYINKNYHKIPNDLSTQDNKTYEQAYYISLTCK